MSDNPTIHNENKSKESNIGWFVTILLFLFAQTIGGSYWAGSLSSSVTSAKEEIRELKGEVNTLRNQNQVLSMQVSALDASNKLLTEQKKGK